MNTKKVIIASVIVAAVGAAAFYTIKVIRLGKKLWFDTINIKLKSLSFNKVTLSADFKVKNKGKLDITLFDLELDIYINEIFVGKMMDLGEIKIKPEATTSTPIVISFDPKLITSNITSILTIGGIDDLPLRFKGKARTKILGITVPIPINFSDTIKNLQ